MKITIEELMLKLSIQEKISLLSETASAIEHAGLKAFHHGNEALHGVVRPGKFTVFPQAIGMGATWNRDLIHDVADAISDESRGKYNHHGKELFGDELGGLYNGLLTFWSPNLNVARDPRWGRTGETYGEDPVLISEIGDAFIRGLQGDKKYLKAVATPKHFTGNNEEHNRFECNAKIPRKLLFDYYLPPFEYAVKNSKAASVMASYNAIDGVPCHANTELLENILRKRWGFDGYVVSDCGAVSHLLDRHKYVNSEEEAAAGALKAGVDLECGSCGTVQQVYVNYLHRALEQGLIKTEDIDKAARRVIEARQRLGIFDETDDTFDHLGIEIVGCEKHAKLALETAEQSMVLLKNEPVKPAKSVSKKPLLPLSDKAGLNICVVGNNANRCQFGDYSGTPVNSPISGLEGIRRVFKNSNITHVPYQDRSKLQDFEPLNGDSLKYINESDQMLCEGLLGTYHMADGTCKTRGDETLQFEWENMAPDPLITSRDFTICWKGLFIAPMSGIFEFRTTANKNGCEGKAKTSFLLDGEQNTELVYQLEKGHRYKVEICYENTCNTPSFELSAKIRRQENTAEFAGEIEEAKKADVVIAFIGLGTEFEAEGRDKTDLNLPAAQLEMLKRIYEVNPSVAVVLYNGSSLTMPWIDENIPAVLEAWYPGESGGLAVANILAGKVSPSGRLPLTFYESVEQLPPFNCYDITAGNGFTYLHHQQKAAYPLGYGLSYSEFAQRIITLSYDREKQQITGTVEVKNIGECDGYEVIQIYAQYSDIEKQVNSLVCFDKVYVKKGEAHTVEISFSAERLRDFDMGTDDYTVRQGSYKISLSRSCIEPIQSETLCI